MAETPNAVLSGLSPEASRRNSVETAALTPRDKENAGANSSRHAEFVAVEQPKPSISNFSTTAAALPPPSKTPALTIQHPHQRSSPSFLSAKTTSPLSVNTQSLPGLKDPALPSNSTKQTTPLSSPASLPLGAQTPPGTSQVLRKHFQSLGFATPGKYTHQQQRLLSSGAVRLTPHTRKKAHKGNLTMASKRIGFDGTKYTPSKELLKSTASSRNHRVLGLLDLSTEHPTDFETREDLNLQQQLNQIQPNLDMMDDETSTVASAATMDDASIDMSLPSMNHHSFLSNNSSHIIPAPHSPLMPRMGCLNPVALTLLNDGKEDYNYLLTQDALYPIPKVEDTTEPGAQPTNTSMSSASSTSSACLSPTRSFGQSPAEVRATLSHTAQSTLARPVAIMAKNGRISPSQPRLVLRPQPKHVR